MAKIYKKIGEDFSITVNVNLSDATDKPLENSEGYAFAIYYKSDNTVIHKYSKNAVTGYDNTNLNTSDEANGNVTLYFLRDYSDGVTYSARPDADVYLEVLTQDADARFTDSQSKSVTEVYCFTWSGSVLSPTVDLS